MATKEHALSKSNSSKTFSCDQCKEVFPNSTKLRSHKQKHQKSDAVTCKTCKKVFAHRASLGRHQRIHTGDRPYECPICTMRFTQGSHMRRHVKLIHESEEDNGSTTLVEGECDVCGACFKTAKGLKVHKKTHGPRKVRFKCEICAKSFEESRQLSMHQKGHKKRFACKVCKKRFFSTTQLSVHAMIHTSKQPHACAYCGQLFRQMGHVRRHEMTAHAQDKRNELRESELAASANENELPKTDKNANEVDYIPNAVSTELHENESEKLPAKKAKLISQKNKAPFSSKKTRHEPRKTSVACNDPSENNQIELDEGKTSNREITTCGISQKSDRIDSGKTEASENSEKSLEIVGANRQIATKPEVKANQCDICFKTFKEASYVKTHRRTHSDEKLFSCECGKSYTFANGLKYHRQNGKCPIKMAEISGVDFKCRHCDEVCKSDSLLKIHEKRHKKKIGNSAALQSRFCRKKFPSKDGADKHEKTHKDHRRYQCNFCNKTFKMSAHVASHKKRVHGNGRKGRKNTKKSTSSATGRPRKRKTSSSNENNDGVYDCEICAKSFSRKNQLVVHKKTHKSAGGFECQTCGKVFKNWNNLHRHELIHSGKKPFVCWVCGKACTQKSNLKSHMNRIHGVSDFAGPVRSEVVSSTNQIHEGQTEPGNSIAEDETSTRSAEQQSGSTSQLGNEIEKDVNCTNTSPRLLHDEDIRLPQPRPRITPERNLFTELKLRKQRNGQVDSTTDNNSISDASDVNKNYKEIQQNEQQKENGFKKGSLLEKLDAEIARLSAEFLRSENDCNTEQPSYQQSNTSLQSKSIAENDSAEVFRSAYIDKGNEMYDGVLQEKFEERETCDEVEGHHEKTFVCCECGEKFDKENLMIKHCVSAH